MHTLLNNLVTRWYAGMVSESPVGQVTGSAAHDSWTDRAALCSEFEMSVYGFGLMGSPVAMTECLAGNCSASAAPPAARSSLH